MTDAVLRSLNEGEVTALHQGLALAARLADIETALSVDLVQALYDRALDRDEKDVEQLIAIGLAFGALIVDGKQFEWARIADEWGEETCVAVIGKVTHTAPISMIQKRIERAEPVSINELRNGTIDALRRNAARALDR